MENLNTTPMKVYTKKQIILGTLLGGPLASGILISKNYKIFGEAEAARKSIYLGILVTLILILFFYLSPNSLIDKFPNLLIPLINIGIVRLIVYYFQKDKINKVIQEGCKKESYWKTIGIGFLSLIVFLIAFIFVFANKAPYDGKVKTFGVTNNQIYYDEGISETEIDEIGRALTAIKLFNDEHQSLVQLRVDGENKYRIIIPSEKSLWNDKQYLWEADNLSAILKEFVPNKEFGVTLLYENLSGSDYKKIN